MTQRTRSNLSRIVTILSVFDALNTPMKTSAVLAKTKISHATGFSLIRALVAEKWLERVDHGLIRLGPRAADLMYSPLEPGIALSAAPQLAVLPDQSAPQSRSVTSEPQWRSDLVEMVDTARFLRSGPVRLGFANASLSNPWRQGLVASLRYAARLNGDRIADFAMRSADDDPDVQIEQINELVASGIDLLIVSCPNVYSSALNTRILELSKTGLPVIALDRRPSDPSGLVSFVTASDNRIGQVTAQWMVEQLGASSRVWLLSGVEGASPSIRRQAAALGVFSSASNITVEAVAYTDWTEEGGYATVGRLLEQFGSPPDGVWCDSGLQGVGSFLRFREEPGPPPIHTGGDINRMYKMAINHKLPFVAVDYPAAMGARAIDVALDVLSGKPVRRRVELAGPVVMPRGHETMSVRADIWAETYVRWDLHDDAVLSQGPSLHERDTSQNEAVTHDA